MEIQFIAEPPFKVDFTQYKRAKRAEDDVKEKIDTMARRLFGLIPMIYRSVTKSAYLTIEYSWISFKQIVLGYYGSLWGGGFHPPADIYLAAFKVIFWVAALFWCFTTTAIRFLLQEMNPTDKNSSSNGLLMELADPGIDLAHLQTKEMEIDLSNVDAQVTVDHLMGMFTQINFDHPEQPGYMPPTTRREGAKTYTTEELKTGLETFIKNVKGRVAFIGTPPAYDTPRLMAFYQQMEDALRFSIHKVESDFETFQQEHGTDLDEYDDAKMKQYKDLLETKARVALDMAIAGHHCAARYMGDAITTYFHLKGKEAVGETLCDTLIELLANKRKEIGEAQVQKFFGSSAESTQGFTKYFGALGQLLAIPGTRNVIEHMDRKVDLRQMVKAFFQQYTIDAMIDAVQEKVATSQKFREQITDWLKDQMGDWGKEVRDVQESIRKIQDIVDREETERPASFATIELFANLIAHLKGNNVALPTDESWYDFNMELFALPESKAWLNGQFANLDGQTLRIKKQQIQNSCSEEALGADLTVQLREAINQGRLLPLPAILKKHQQKQKIQAIRKVLPIEEESVKRILSGESNLEEAVKNYNEMERSRDFLFQLELDRMFERKSLSPEMLEWLLVSHHIFNPQGGDSR